MKPNFIKLPSLSPSVPVILQINEITNLQNYHGSCRKFGLTFNVHDCLGYIQAGSGSHSLCVFVRVWKDRSASGCISWVWDLNPRSPPANSLSFKKKNTFYHLALLTMTFNWERERRGVQVMRGAVTNCWIKVMAWPWSFLSDDPQHWPRQSSARKQTLSSAWGENCAPFDACVSLNTLLSTHFYKQIVNALPRAKVHKNQLIESSLRVSTIQHASFSRQDSNRCTLDLVTESLFYPLLTNFTSFPPLLTHIHPFSISFFKSFTIPLHRLLLFLLPVKSSERCCMSGQRRDRSVFSVMLSDCCAASVHQVSHLPRQAHSPLWNQTALRLNREQMLYTSPELQTTALSL